MWTAVDVEPRVPHRFGAAACAAPPALMGPDAATAAAGGDARSAFLVFGGMSVDSGLSPVVFRDLWLVALPADDDAPAGGDAGVDIVDASSDGGGDGGGGAGAEEVGEVGGGADVGGAGGAGGGDDLGFMVIGRRMVIEEIRDYDDVEAEEEEGGGGGKSGK